ncbi:MAG: prenyltransferase/squalene oxidase repeat-containing protein [Bacillota bacterium]|nr:prenyltransferase/squalene oxidase repeat-containing protein [Bacillota bacterium]
MLERILASLLSLVLVLAPVNSNSDWETRTLNVIDQDAYVVGDNNRGGYAPFAPKTIDLYATFWFSLLNKETGCPVEISPHVREEIIRWVLTLQKPDGSFARTPGGKGNLYNTYLAVCLFELYGFKPDDKVTLGISRYLSSLSSSSGLYGWSLGDKGGIPATYIALQLYDMLDLHANPDLGPVILALLNEHLAAIQPTPRDLINWIHPAVCSLDLIDMPLPELTYKKCKKYVESVAANINTLNGDAYEITVISAILECSKVLDCRNLINLDLWCNTKTFVSSFLVSEDFRIIDPQITYKILALREFAGCANKRDKDLVTIEVVKYFQEQGWYLPVLREPKPEDTYYALSIYLLANQPFKHREEVSTQVKNWLDSCHNLSSVLDYRWTYFVLENCSLLNIEVDASIKRMLAHCIEKDLEMLSALPGLNREKINHLFWLMKTACCLNINIAYEPYRQCVSNLMNGNVWNNYDIDTLYRTCWILSQVDPHCLTVYRDQILFRLAQFSSAEGGFMADPRQAIANIYSTWSAVLIYDLLDQSPRHVYRTLSFIDDCKLDNGGATVFPREGKSPDLRATWCVIQLETLIGEIRE